MTLAEKAASLAEEIAADNSHGYKWGGWGPQDYDCGHLVIDCYERAGVPVKTAGATYTGNMRAVFQRCGFHNVTSTVDLRTGAGLRRGDVLLNDEQHAAIYVGGGQIVQARTDLDGRPGDSSGQEIRKQAYYDYPWRAVLRYDTDAKTEDQLKPADPQPAEPQPETPPVQTLPIGVKVQEFTLTFRVLQQGAGMGQFSALREEVRALQRQLKSLGFDLGRYGLDGEFGSDTKQAVMAYQRSVRLAADGIVGPDTRAALEGVVV